MQAIAAGGVFLLPGLAADLQALARRVASGDAIPGAQHDDGDVGRLLLQIVIERLKLLENSPGA